MPEYRPAVTSPHTVASPDSYEWHGRPLPPTFRDMRRRYRAVVLVERAWSALRKRGFLAVVGRGEPR
jgi:hypothetical protein